MQEFTRKEREMRDDLYMYGCMYISMRCKYCGRQRVVKAGLSYYGAKRQRYLCKDCGRTFLKEKVK